MSKYNTPVLKDIQSLSGGISKITFVYKRPSNSTVSREVKIEETNEYTYVGRDKEWILIDGSAVAPEHHITFLTNWGQLHKLQSMFSKWLEK